MPPWVLVSAGFHDQGGQSRANAALADHLRGRGTPLHLVGHDFAARFTGDPGCTIHRVRRPLGADSLGILGLRRAGRAVARQVCAADPAARVLVNGGCCHWPDLNWVHYVHSSWRPAESRGPLWFRVKDAVAGTLARRDERQALAAARLVLANSGRTRQALIIGLGLPAERVRTVYLGSDPAWHPPGAAERAAARAWLGQSEDRPLVVFVGGFGHDERKGFDTLWSAWSRLCGSADWDADLVAAGGGSRAAWWRDRITREGLAGRARLIGFTDRVFDVLAAADLLVSPVRYEPYGLNVQEAVCRGVPAVVSACAGVVEQYSPELAPLVLPDPEDADDLARRLRAWRVDLTGWRERFRPLSESLRGRTWERMAEDLVALAERETTRNGVVTNAC
jgi:glycosyltransferase involved in cell wall biosynthesis